MEPLYTAANVNPAYQLRWSLSLFPKRALPPIDVWLSQLKQVVERDAVRILEVRQSSRGAWLFFLTTQPQVVPTAIVKSVKGRLQHVLRPSHPDAFRRNFQLTAVGDAKRTVVEEYVASQLEHHRMADDRVQTDLSNYQLEFPEVNIADRQMTAHGAYVYGLHLVLVHEGRWHEIREDKLVITRDMALKIAKIKGHRLSRLAVLSDHVHIVSAIPPAQSPQDVALAYLNNLAFAHEMRPLFAPSYYVGTIGEYDTGAIWQSL